MRYVCESSEELSGTYYVGSSRGEECDDRARNVRIARMVCVVLVSDF